MAQPQNEELSKLLKKLGYPDVGDGNKPSTLLAKAVSACQKRMSKLQEVMPNRPQAPQAHEADAAAATPSKESKDAVIQQRPGPEISTFLPNHQNATAQSLVRFYDKLMKMYTAMDECCDELLQFQTNGLLDGFSNELSVLE